MSKAAVSRPRVYVRIRPLNEKESRDGKGQVICRGDERQQDVLFFEKEENGPELQIRFDHIFDQQVTQEDVYNYISPEVLRTLFSGYNASVFAYGQTGSGKTHTMEGAKTADGTSAIQSNDTANYGLIPRLIQGIFDNFSSNKDITDALVEVSFVQIYQEKIQDLLNKRQQLEIHMDKDAQYVARDATWKKVSSLSDCMKLYAEASKMRATSATEMNLVSSRSHMILMLKLQWDEPTLPGSHAQLNLIDLAGSERLDESGAKGETMKEAIHINKSLSSLGIVVTKLVEQAKRPNKRIHIPYKDSKLTYLLQSSLGGSNLTHFMLAVSSSAMWRSETNSTIEFGKRALQLVLRPVRNAIDYTRLAEMEAMIEKMRTHIASLEEELHNKQSIEAAGFLQIKQIDQNDDEEEGRYRRRRRESGRSRKHLKRQTELNRIMANLPETFDDLTSHCVLFPESKVTFRELQGLEKLIHYVDKSASTFYRSNAAQTIASVIEDTGREQFADMGGLDALTRLLQVKEERCKEAACVAFEAVCRGSNKNKAALQPAVYEELVELIYGYPNQQVQEAACSAVATIVDGYQTAARQFEKLDIVPKLLETIRITPEEVVNLTKAATNCVGRLAHGDKAMQDLIASLGGVDLLIDVLFSPGGDRDHQIPILASYALVNLCCSHKKNFKLAKEHPRYHEVKFRLLEGLARAFGSNTAREGFGRATAQESAPPFPYYGVTVLDKWTVSSSGGRPIFASFMDNPQFYFKVTKSCDVTFIIQDILYEVRMRKKRKNNAVYMGIAIFEGDSDLSKANLKQLDFHGKIAELGKYTSNCENVLHCHLEPSDTPYMVVPFTSQKGRQTEFALTAFSDHPIELTAVPDFSGWVHNVVDGCWTEFTGRGGSAFDWRCNPQIQLYPKEDCRVVFVLSYLSLDKQRAAMTQEDEDEEFNHRPRLHGRIFTSEFAPEKRYLKAIVPLPQGSTFIGSNSFSGNSYITTTVTLQGDKPYVFIPFTETPFQDTFRVSVYCDSDQTKIETLSPMKGEWLVASMASNWMAKPFTASLETKGKVVVVAYSAGVFLRVRLYDGKDKKVAGIDSYWNSEAAVEYDAAKEKKSSVKLQVEGMVRNEGGGGKHQEPALDRPFDIFIFSEQTCEVRDVVYKVTPSSWPVPTQSTSGDLLRYPRLLEDDDAGLLGMEREEDLNDSDSDDATAQELLEDLDKKEEENRQLMEKIQEQERQLALLKIATTSATSSPLAEGSRKESDAGKSKGRSPSVSSDRRQSGASGNQSTVSGKKGLNASTKQKRSSSVASSGGKDASSKPPKSSSTKDSKANSTKGSSSAKEEKAIAELKDKIQQAITQVQTMERLSKNSKESVQEDMKTIHLECKKLRERLQTALEVYEDK